MEIKIRKVTFTLHRTNGAADSFTKEIAGDDEMVKWANQRFAEVNECGCTAQIEGNQVAIAGNVQQ